MEIIPPDDETPPQDAPRIGTGERASSPDVRRATGDPVLAAKLRYMRDLRGLPLKAAASRARVAIGTLSDYEHARRTPSVYALARLSKVYGVSPYYFMDHLAKLDQDPAA